MIALQTSNPPFSSYEEAIAYIKTLKSISVKWDRFCVLSDKNHHNTVLVLLLSRSVASAFRANISADEAWEIATDFREEGLDLELAVTAKNLKSSALSSLDKIEKIIEDSSKSKLLLRDLKDVLSEPLKGSKKGTIKRRGRGEPFDVETARRVFDDSSMRCMFEGCAVRLDNNELTGDESYFGYLAHIVASSENGPRGEVGISNKLSNVASNVMLLCDKCHRLIDKVACADYPRTKLDAMRSRFIKDKNMLLDLLAFSPVSAYSLVWPINRHCVSPPTAREISSCLATSNLRIKGGLQIIEDSNNSNFNDLKDDAFWRAAPGIVTNAYGQIRQTAQQSEQSYGLFVMGPMPLLVGLGSLIGNKSNAIPELKSRELGEWGWPLKAPVGNTVHISEHPKVPKDLDSVIVRLELTASPQVFQEKSKEIHNSESTLDIILAPEKQSTSCIGHPQDGLEFQNLVNQLLHKINVDYRVAKIHLFVCASNACCIYFGRAIEQYHPEVLVYDMSGMDSLVPRIRITPSASGSELATLDC